jgi:hypothetical protein
MAYTILALANASTTCRWATSGNRQLAEPRLDELVNRFGVADDWRCTSRRLS